MSDLHKITIHEAHKLLKEKKVSSVELTEAVLEHLHKVEGKVRACVTITDEKAVEYAKAADRVIAGGDIKPLTGVPALIKDVICTKGIRTTCSSKMLENFVPPYDANVIEKLKADGYVIVGKTNMDEFAMGSSTENSAFFVTHNPWNLDCVPGGSSGGSAAGTASDEAIYSLGSDTGGSIRQPAGLCGVVGLKPTYGRVSRYGLVAFASSLDQIGPITKDVTDSALIMNTIAGHDKRDSTTVPYEVPDYTKALKADIKNVRIGIPREYFVEGMQPAVRKAIEAAIKKLEELGAKVDRNVSLPYTEYALAAYYILAPSEASANLARYDGVKYGFSYRDTTNMWEAMEKTKQYGFGAEVKRRIMLGTYALSAGYYDAYYLKAQKVRTLIKRDFEKAFGQYDVLVTPVSPTTAFKIGEKVDDPVQMYLSDVCTLPINIAGVPAISIPAGFVDGLPVGMQIIGKHFSEEMLLRVAYAYEQATPWHTKKPSIA
ncbi:MAG: Asp-tRNA(Asn)/Glu-tRNA(Gln) amidotransferase subunit GatA [Dehalococcoidia bacterium]|jgi:aspartyl-tRNA(Asn)/glutamyl-tRNA(Gln) amidotransferase subunit A